MSNLLDGNNWVVLCRQLPTPGNLYPAWGQRHTGTYARCIEVMTQFSVNDAAHEFAVAQIYAKTKPVITVEWASLLGEKIKAS